MNTTRHLTPALMIAATLAAAFGVANAEAAEPANGLRSTTGETSAFRALA